MDKKAYVRSKMFVNITSMAPPLIRDRIVSDRELNERFKITVDGPISFGDSGPNFKRSKLATALKSFTARTNKKGSSKSVEDLDGTVWSLENTIVDDERHLMLASGTRAIRVDDLALLGENKSLRVEIFDREVRRTNIPKSCAEFWREILTDRALDEQEMMTLAAEFANTPASREAQISQSLRRGGGTETLVPRSLEYYERLIGICAGEATIQLYAANRVKMLSDELLAWNRVDGAKQLLSLALHPSIIDTLAGLDLTETELASLMLWAAESGDVVSRGALIELAIRRSNLSAESQAALQTLAKLYAGETTEVHEQFELFGTAFIAIYGELGQTGLLLSKPVYWRRLAAASQAALICRAILKHGKPIPKFVEWLRNIRSLQYLIHCNIDYRTDPRWMAEFVLPENLKCELAGRVVSTALMHSDEIGDPDLKELLLSEDPPSLRSQLSPILMITSGPLEGNSPSLLKLPDAELEKLSNLLEAAAPTASSFAPLVGAVLISSIPSNFADLAASALRRAQYKLDTPADREELSQALRGLAQFAAISRSDLLADALFIVVRNYRRNFPDEIDASAAFRIGIIACASRSEFEPWCKAVGNFVNDFSFGNLTRSEAEELFPWVLSLCDMVPELWAFAGQGVAALEAVKAA